LFYVNFVIRGLIDRTHSLVSYADVIKADLLILRVYLSRFTHFIAIH